MGKLSTAKDWVTIVASIAAAGSFVFSAHQFYLGRLALQSQTIREATKQAIEIQNNMINKSKIYSTIYDTKEDIFLEQLAIRQIFSLYVNMYYDREADLIPDDAWKAIEKEICDFAKRATVRPIVNASIKRMQYPTGFIIILKECL